MSNINRDYLIILDVKSGEVDSPNIYYFNTDKNTSNLYVQMVIKETNIEATPIDNATNYSIKANILKPNMVGKIVEGNLVNEAKAIYEFKLPADCTDFSGNAKIEFEVYCAVDGVEEIATSFATKFKVHGSVLTEQNKYIEDSSDYPILKDLMAEAKELNTQSKELNTDSRKLHEELSGALEAEEQRKANESIRIANENARQSAETTRISNENTRESAEASRIAYENRRESQERDRVSNEYDRQNYEQDREYAENARQEAEAARAGAEATRVTAENDRKTQEALRQEAEANRVTAEQAREASNTAMRQDITSMQNEISNFEATTNREIEGIRTSTGQEIDTMKVIVENQNAKIDYIKENDRKQDILINGIFNSQDNKLTSTKEGNVHDLVESKPGLLYVDEIVGNTMVNCNKEADKSIVLSGAINEEGTNNITLTQGVDGAKADVYVEGNTMVNVCDQEEAVAITTDTNTFPLRYLYASTNYILQFESDKNVTIDITLGGYTLSSQNIAVGLNKINITTPATLADNNLVLDGIGFSASNIVVTEAVEGDFGYFKGMKSVGEQEGNKIEILSSNKNLFDVGTGSSTSKYNLTATFDGSTIILNGQVTSMRWIDVALPKPIILKSGTYTLSKYSELYTNGIFLQYYDESGKQMKFDIGSKTFNTDVTFSSIAFDCFNGYSENPNFNNVEIKIQLEEASSATDYVPHADNKKQILLNEPLRKVGDIADKYVLVDGKWYIERNCREVVLDGSESWTYFNIPADGTIAYARSDSMNLANGMDEKVLYCDKIKTVKGSSYNYNEKMLYSYHIQNENKLYLHLSVSELSSQTLSGFKQWLQSNPLTVVYQLASPIYEPIDYNPLDIYSDTTHISINSNIPAKLKVRNHGYNCMLKPSTTYTATYSMNNTPQKVTLTTGSILDDSIRFTGTGTLDNFLLLEGDISNPPTFFSGMRSCFDQEYDEVKGKWKVNMRVEGADTYNDITIYINEPLRKGDIIRAENRKILVERHMAEVILDGSDDENWRMYQLNTKANQFLIDIKGKSTPLLCDKFNNNLDMDNENEQIRIWNDKSIELNILKLKLQTQDTTGFKQWLQQNPVTVVYQLAEPIIEEVETDYTRLMLESYENATVYFNSHIFPTSTIRYQANVISTSEIMSVNDEQDSMIIDNATQIAMINLTM